MPSVPLPENPSLEHLKNQAKLVQDLVRARDEGALGMVCEFHPKLADAAAAAGAAAGFKRSDAQLVIARLYQFSSWARLRDHLGGVEQFARRDPADLDYEDLADVDRFVALACVSYNERRADRLDDALQMLAADPGLARASVAAMAVTGDYEALAAALEVAPALVDSPCGPSQLPPLLYCCYSRSVADDDGQSALSGLSTLRTVALLLEHGADPNAGFLWHGLVPPFTALTGAFGGGEQDQAPHAEAFALARLLLQAGADPNDGQALYNNGLAGTAHDDPGHLELLVEFGLGTDQGGPWYERFGSRLTSPQELLYDELEIAAHRGLVNRMRFLVGLGLDLERGVGRSGKTPARLAARKGHADVMAVLEQAGVAMTLDAVEAFVAVARSGSAEQVRGLLAEDPSLLARLIGEQPALIAEIAAATRRGVIEELMAAGFDIDARDQGGITALHGAASEDDIDLVRALVELGADVTATDANFDATALGWARHNNAPRVEAYLAPLTPDAGA